jgi:FAD/FMN-containing dehydrogenase
VTVDPTARTAIVAPGATLGDVDAATAPHALALPMGINSTTGIAGLTLGGGFGWLTRKHGLTVDNLLSAEVVTADGDRLTASASRNADLFWGIRGGGGNFGVVTSFTFRLHQVGPDLLCGLIVHPFAKAPALLREYRRIAAAAPDELTAWVVLRKAPPLPVLPPEVHGKEVMVIAAVFAGDVREGEKALQPLRALGIPIADVIAPQPFAAFQQAFDPLLGAGARNYWKSHDYTALSDGVLDVTLEYAARLPNEQCEIFIAHLGGAAGRVPADATAYAHRDAEFVMNVHTRWTDPAEDRKCVGWAREFFDRAAPFATGGVYVNFMPDDEADRVPSAYGGNYQRLVQLKAKYDPENFFRQNQNIRPAGR